MKGKNKLGLIPINTLLFFVVLCLGTEVFATDKYSNLESKTQQLLKELRRVGIPNSSVGVSVTIIPSTIYPFEPVRYGFNSKKKFNPASTVKLFTSFYALSVLGSSYRFKTDFFIVGKRDLDSFDGDFYLKGRGDPKLVYEDLQEIVYAMRAKGYRKLRGNFIIDDSYFSEPEINAASFDGKKNKPYNVGPNAALVNFKAVELTVAKVKRKINISLKPQLADFTVVNNMRWVRGSCGKNKIFYKEFDGKLKVYGRFGTRCKRQRLYLSLSTHKRFAFGLFKQAWIDSGGQFDQVLIDGVVPKEAELVYSWTSPRSLKLLIKDINTLSNNTMARTMFLTLSAGKGSPGTLEKSRRLLSSWFYDLGIGLGDVTIENGSGLSRLTKLTPTHIDTLLYEATFSKEFQVWKKSLALAGKEGTTVNRFRGMDVSGNAWLKTGSLDNVQAYAGYVLTETKRWISFAILVNHRVAERAKLPLDKFIDSLYRDAGPQLLVEGSKQVK